MSFPHRPKYVRIRDLSSALAASHVGYHNPKWIAWNIKTFISSGGFPSRLLGRWDKLGRHGRTGGSLELTTWHRSSLISENLSKYQDLTKYIRKVKHNVDNCWQCWQCWQCVPLHCCKWSLSRWRDQWTFFSWMRLLHFVNSCICWV